ncbi:MAG: hypothetical protein GX756_06215, partial [Clostridiales bacterium]|nr:hypothetical protein [Clostridiales bacterium]
KRRGYPYSFGGAVKEAVAVLKQRREKYEGYLKHLDESGKTHCKPK